MNPLKTLLAQPAVEALGWTLLHFLWQGAVIAIAFAITRLLLRRSSANRRYVAGCAAMLLLMLAPVVTFFSLATSDAVFTPPSPRAEVALSPPPAIHEVSSPTPPATVAPRQSASLPGANGSTFRIGPWLPWLVGVWLTGVSILLLRLLLGWVHLRRLTRLGIDPMENAWQDRLENLQRRLAVSRPVKLLKSSLVEVPAVIGWLRPVILIPASALSGLTPSQLESILAHELAHIRRHDYIVNLLQNVLETLLFYHPAIWWVSRCVREERENCCDDLAVETLRNPRDYAEALACLEGLRHLAPQFAVRADGSQLLPRVRRVLGLSANQRSGRLQVSGLIALLVVTLTLAGVGVSVASQREPVYYGLPVSAWIAALETDFRHVAEDVLKEAGTDAAVQLAKAVTAEAPWYSQSYYAARSALPQPLADRLPEANRPDFRYTRMAAAGLLSELGAAAEPAVPALVRALDDEHESVRRSAARTLGRLPRGSGAPAVPKLIPMLSEPNAESRKTAADALGWIGPAAGKAAPALAARLNDPDRWVRIMSAQSLGLIGAHPDASVPALMQAAETDDAELRSQAIQSLGRFGSEAAAAVPLIAEAVADPDPQIQNSALRALAGIGMHPTSLTEFLDEVSRGDEINRARSATFALWRNDRDNEEFRQRVIQLLLWPDPPQVRRVAVHLLSLVDPPPVELVPDLEAHLRASDFDMRRFAAKALVRIDPRREAELSDYLERPVRQPRSRPVDPERARVIEIIASNHFDTGHIIPILVRLLDDPETASAAATGIADTGKEGWTRLISLLYDERGYVQLAALDALMSRGFMASQRFEVLTRLLLDSDETLRFAAAERLSYYTYRLAASDLPDDFLAAIEAAATDPNEKIREKANRALARIEANS